MDLKKIHLKIKSRLDEVQTTPLMPCINLYQNWRCMPSDMATGMPFIILN